MQSNTPQRYLRQDLCYNCYRHNDGDSVVTIPVPRRSTMLRTSAALRFCNLQDRKVQTDDAIRQSTGTGIFSPILLCQDCLIYLNKRDRKVHPDLYVNVWAAYLWKHLSSDRVLKVPGMGQSLWKILPMKWRMWWIDELRTLSYRQKRGRDRDPVYPYSNCELTDDTYFEDVTEEYKAVVTTEKDLKIKTLFPHWNNHCVNPNVKCPWGCTEFLAQCGMVRFDDMLRQFTTGFIWTENVSMPETIRNKHFKSFGTLSALQGARPDYLTSQPGSLLENGEQYLIRRCIIIHPEHGAAVLTCKHHDKGSPLQYVHPPRNPRTTIHPSEEGDQLAPAVLVPRQIQPMKKRKFSSTYGVSRVQANFKGIDSCYIRDIGSFDRQSDIRWENEMISLSNRQDLQRYMVELCEMDLLPEAFVQEYFKELEKYDATNLITDDAIHAAREGATFVPWRDALKMHNLLAIPHYCNNFGPSQRHHQHQHYPTTTHDGDNSAHRRIDSDDDGVYDDGGSSLSSDDGSFEDGDGDEQESGFRNRPFTPQWLPALIRVQTSNDGYGSVPNCISGMHGSYDKGYDMSCVWLLTSMINIVPDLWECMDRNVANAHKWHGWYLHYASKYKLIADLKFKQARKSGKTKGRKTNPYSSYNARTKSYNLNHLMTKMFKTIHEDDEIPAGEHDLFQYTIYDTNDFLKLCSTIDPVHIKVMILASRRNLRRLAIGAKVKHLILGRDLDTTEPLQETIEVSNGRKFRLLYMAFVNRGFDDDDRNDQIQVNNWNAVACGRHTSNSKKWWCMQRKRLPYKSHLYQYEEHDDKGPWYKYNTKSSDAHDFPDVPVQLITEWDIAVYVLDVEEEECVKESTNKFYETIGGQTDVYCKEHRKYSLVFVSPKEQKHCSVEGCLLLAHHECVHHRCSVKCCMKHFKLFRKDAIATETKIYIGKPNDEDMKKESKDDKEDGIDGGPYDASNTDNADSTDDSSNPDFTFLYDTASNDNKLPTQNPYQFDAEDNADFFPNNDDASSNDSVQSSQSLMDTVPTTTAGQEGKKASIAAKNFKTIHLYFMINAPGNALMRRNHELKGTLTEEAFLQRIVAVNGTCVPLIFPEAMFFPSIFYATAADGISMIGALPSCLWTDERTAAKFNFASAHEHSRCRVLNSRLLCGRDPRYIQLMFDINTNLRARGVDGRLVQSRGMEGLYGEGGPAIQFDQNRHCGQYTCEVIDNSKSVNCLAGMNRTFQPTLFMTTTLNMKGFPGVKQISNLLEQMEDQLLTKDRLNGTNRKPEYSKALHQAAMIDILRTYDYVYNLYLNWIVSSTEMPLGRIIASWDGSEHQEASQKPSGTMPHHHTVLYGDVDLTNEADLSNVQSLVRCSPETLLNSNDCQFLKDNDLMGNVSNDSDVLVFMHQLQSDYRVLGVHRCRNAKHRCMLKNQKGEYVCRCVHYAKQNPNMQVYNYKEIPMNLTNLVKEILLTMDFMMTDECSGEIVIKDIRLRAGLHVYPTNRDEQWCPVNGILFTLLRGSINLQICDHAMSERYLTTYTAMIDKRARVLFSADVRHGTLQIEADLIPNTKIASNREVERKEMKKRRNKNKIEGVMTNTAEMLSFILQVQRVRCTETFVDIPTMPLEDRGGLRKAPMLHFGTAEEASKFVSHGTETSELFGSIEGRELLQFQNTWRALLQSQETMLRDQFCAKVSVDNLTRFGLRPPELMFVDSQVDYHKCFFQDRLQKLKIKRTTDGVRITITQQFVNQDVMKSAWIDALEKQTFVRRAGLQFLLDEYQRVIPQSMILLFHCLYYDYHNTVHSSITTNEQQGRIRTATQLFDSSLFFHDDDNNINLPIPIWPCIKPTKGHKFLVHILLSMGRFNNEMELWNASSLAEAFYNAKLLPSLNPSENDITAILRRYIDEQLFYTPSSKQRWTKYLLAAKEILHEALILNSLADVCMPSFLYTSIARKVELESQKYLDDIKQAIVQTLQPLVKDAPDQSALLKATKHDPCNWEPTILGLPHQSAQSLYEQKMAFDLIRKKIDLYCSLQRVNKRMIILHGFAGSGKTYIQHLVALYAISKGLTVANTSTAARRSRQNGGIHIARILRFMKDAKDNTEMSADYIIRRVYGHADTLCFLTTIDVLNIDEGELESAEFYSTLDMVLRYIRNSTDYMGGLIITITMHINQLRCINGTPLLASPNMVVAATIIDLQHFVRSRHDKDLQDLIRLMEQNEFDENDYKTFGDIIRANCPCVQRWEDRLITSNVLRILSKRLAVELAEKAFINHHIRGQENTIMVTAEAYDETRSRGTPGQWKPVEHDKRIFYALSKNSKMPKTLELYENAVVEMTFNSPNVWDQGDVCILRHLPSQAGIDKWDSLKGFLNHSSVNLPPVDFQSMSDEALEASGWKPIDIPSHTSEKISVRNVIGQRTQYPIHSRHASTIHKVCGDTLQKGATRISDNPSSPYYLWEKGLAVVLLTRFEKLSDLIFVDPGGIQNVIDVLWSTLKLRSPYQLFQRQIIDKIAVRFVLPDENSITPFRVPQPPIVRYIDNQEFPFVRSFYGIPSKNATDEGFLYMLYSTSHPGASYIGQTSNLKKRLQAHNKGHQEHIADPTKRPWAPLVYFTGFESDHQRMSLELEWQRERETLVRNQTATFARIVKAAIYMFERKHLRIMLHKCYILPEGVRDPIR